MSETSPPIASVRGEPHTDKGANLPFTLSSNPRPHAHRHCRAHRHAARRVCLAVRSSPEVMKQSLELGGDVCAECAVAELLQPPAAPPPAATALAAVGGAAPSADDPGAAQALPLPDSAANAAPHLQGPSMLPANGSACVGTGGGDCSAGYDGTDGSGKAVGSGHRGGAHGDSSMDPRFEALIHIPDSLLFPLLLP